MALFAIGFASGFGTAGSGFSATEAMGHKNLVTMEVKHPDCATHPENPKCGMPPESQGTWNTVTVTGDNWTRDALSGTLNNAGTANNWTVLELSTNSTTSTTDYACGSPITTNALGIGRGNVTVLSGAQYGNYTVSATWYPSGTQAAIVKVCMSNQTTSASSWLMAEATFSSTNVNSGDTLIVNYSVAVR